MKNFSKTIAATERHQEIKYVPDWPCITMTREGVLNSFIQKAIIIKRISFYASLSEGNDLTEIKNVQALIMVIKLNIFDLEKVSRTGH